MKLGFMGTPDFSVPVLSDLIAAGHEVAAVYTRAPKPARRGQKLTRSPVHAFAESCGIEVRTPKNFKAPETVAEFIGLDLDVAVVVAYGLILPRAILDAPHHGCLNLHASLLPRWRGAAPIQRAIMAGDDVTGVQVMRMEEGLDTGPILLSETTPITAADTAATLHDRLAAIGAQLAPRALAALSRGALQETPQSEEGVLYAEKISSAEARIDWSQPAAAVDCHIRGLSPFPGAWFMAGEHRIKALFSRCVDTSVEALPGTVIEGEGRLVIACGDGAVEIETVQRAGKAASAAKDFLRGFSMPPGPLA